MVLRTLFLNRQALWLVMVSVAHAAVAQILVLALADVAQQVSTDRVLPVAQLAIIAACLATGYVLAPLVGLTTLLWHQAGIEAFLHRATHVLVGRTDVFNRTDTRAHRTTGLMGAGWEILDGVCSYLQQLWLVAVRAVLTIATVSYLVNPALLLAYAASLILNIALARGFQPELSRSSYRMEQRRIHLSQAHLGAWENVTLDNPVTSARWGESQSRAIRLFRKARYRNFVSITKVQVSITLLAHLPTLAVLAYLMAQRELNSGLIALVVALPKLLEAMDLQGELASMVSAAGVAKAKLQILRGYLSSPERQSLEEHINLSALGFTIDGRTAGFSRLDGAADGILTSRHTVISGPNGAGKSSLLQLLKQQLGKEAFYYRPDIRQHFDFRTNGESTGQRVLRELELLFSIPHARVLLLDEWNANLDASAQDQVRSRIVEWTAAGGSLVEVRHH